MTKCISDEMYLLPVFMLITMVAVVSSETTVEPEGSGDPDGSGDPVGSGDVCNVDGSTCPSDKCCRQDVCTNEGGELRCCKDPTIEPDKSDPTCSNCPKCGRSSHYLLILSHTIFSLLEIQITKYKYKVPNAFNSRLCVVCMVHGKGQW